MKFLISAISIFFIVTSCQKQYGESMQPVRVAPPETKGTAVFTFYGAPNPCGNISRGGMFTTGIPVTSLNRVKIDVNVIVPGTYFITTPVINGFSFPGSGDLQTMGYGTVLLQASGTPVASSTFIFTPDNNGCKFAIYVYP